MKMQPLPLSHSLAEATLPLAGDELVFVPGHVIWLPGQYLPSTFPLHAS